MLYKLFNTTATGPGTSYSKRTFCSLQRGEESSDSDTLGLKGINSLVRILITRDLCFSMSQGTKSIFTRIRQAFELTPVLLD